MKETESTTCTCDSECDCSTPFSGTCCKDNEPTESTTVNETVPEKQCFICGATESNAYKLSNFVACEEQYNFSEKKRYSLHTATYQDICQGCQQILGQNLVAKTANMEDTQKNVAELLLEIERDSINKEQVIVAARLITFDVFEDIDAILCKMQENNTATEIQEKLEEFCNVGVKELTIAPSSGSSIDCKWSIEPGQQDGAPALFRMEFTLSIPIISPITNTAVTIKPTYKPTIPFMPKQNRHETEETLKIN